MEDHRLRTSDGSSYSGVGPGQIVEDAASASESATTGTPQLGRSFVVPFEFDCAFLVTFS